MTKIYLKTLTGKPRGKQQQNPSLQELNTYCIRVCIRIIFVRICD